MLDSNTLMDIVNEQLDAGRGTLSHDSITVGVVVDTDDPLQNGRLRVYCPNLNDSPKKLHHLPWAVCASPLAGTISNAGFTRGAGKGPENTTGAVSYGFWGIPEQGAIVLVAKIDGDDRRRVWLGCIPNHQETHTLMHGRYKWAGDNGEPDGPLSSTCNPIEPYYTNAGTAFDNDRTSREWKTRQAEYQACAIPKDISIPAEGLEDYIDEQYKNIAKEERDEWVRDILGSHGYDWSSNKSLGSFMASKVYGWSTPGFHSISMDDRAYNNRIRIRSSTGHQLIFDDTNERIYLATNEGNNFVEFDSNGNIDIYSKRRVSVHAEKDINFSTDESFRVKAKKGIYMYSGDTTAQEKLDAEKPENGEIRLHSTGDMHLMVEKNLRGLVKEDNFMEIGKSSFISIGDRLKTQVESGIDFIINDGNYNISIEGDYYHNVSGDTSIFSGGNNIMQAVNNTEIFSYTGKLDMGSQLAMSLKSFEGDMTLEAIEKNMKLKSNAGQNQITMRNPAINIFTVGQAVVQSSKEIAYQVYNGFEVVDGNPGIDGQPLAGQCLRIDGGVNVSFDPNAINMDAVEDVFMKVQNGISNQTGKLDTRVSDINKSLEQLETNVNDFIFTTQSSLQGMVDSWLEALPDGFVIPGLPQFPQPPQFRFPAINLPEFDFNFCINIADPLNIEEFNSIPTNMFGTINLDLGGWTLSNIKNWASRHKNKLYRSLNNLESGVATGRNAFEFSLGQIKDVIEGIKFSLSTLASFTVTDKGTEIARYTTGINSFRDAVGEYNNLVDAHNTSVGFMELDKLTELENELGDHARTFNNLNKLVQENPSQINNFDYSELEDTALIFQDYLNGLNQIA